MFRTVNGAVNDRYPVREAEEGGDTYSDQSHATYIERSEAVRQREPDFRAARGAAKSGNVGRRGVKSGGRGPR